MKQKVQIYAELNVIFFPQGKNSKGVTFEAGENFSVGGCVLRFLPFKFLVVYIKIPVVAGSCSPIFIVLILNVLLDFTNFFEI